MPAESARKVVEEAIEKIERTVTRDDASDDVIFALSTVARAVLVLADEVRMTREKLSNEMAATRGVMKASR